MDINELAKAIGPRTVLILEPEQIDTLILGLMFATQPDINDAPTEDTLATMRLALNTLQECAQVNRMGEPAIVTTAPCTCGQCE